MIDKTLHIIIIFVWFINGFICKILNLVPRHQEIVGRILGNEYSSETTFTIGLLEVLMAIWILSKFKTRLNSIMQIAIIITMNIIEFFLAKDLLLFGYLNSVFALLFVTIIYYKEFILNEKRYV